MSSDQSASKDDFAYWWHIKGEWVEPPNERRNGWSGMTRARLGGSVLYVKRQLNHLCRTLRHPFGWPTVSREYHYLERLRQLGVGALRPVFHGVRHSADGVEAVLVTEELSGFAALSAFDRLDGQSKTALAEQLGSLLGRVHGARLQHGSLYDKHVMARQVEGEHFDVALIDLEKMRVRLTRGQAAAHDLEQLQRRQQVFGRSQWQALLAAHGQAFRRRP